MPGIIINQDKCVGCGLCVDACPFGAIVMENGKARIIDDKCTLCGACVSACNFEAIELLPDERKVDDSLSQYKGVWVFAEQKNGKPINVVYELIGKGRELADDLGVELSGVILGNEISDGARKLIEYGADKVYAVEDTSLANFNDESYADIFTQLIVKYKPEIVLMGATTYGRSLAPRVASRLNTGLTADCTELQIDKEKRLLLQTRPAFGGNLMATIICPDTRPQMATVRPKVMKPLEPDSSRTGEIIYPEVTIPRDLKTKVKEVVSSVMEMVNLTEADIIVAGGRGLGEASNFKLIEELARVLAVQ